MAKQKPHVRTSSRGKKFVAGRGSNRPLAPAPKVPKNLNYDLFSVDNVVLFKKHMQVLNNVLQFADVTLYGQGVEFAMMDPANVAAVSVKYKTDADNSGMIGSVNMDNLYKQVRLFKASEPFVFEQGKDSLVLRGAKKKASVILTQSEYQPYSLNWDLNWTATLWGSNGKSTELSYETKVELDGEYVEDFKDALTSTKETLQFVANENGALIRRHSEIEDPYELVLIDEPVAGGEARAQYAASYLKAVAPILSKNALVRLFWSTDYPLFMMVEQPNFVFSMVLAPRVDTQ